MGCTGRFDLITSVTHTSKREVLRRISLGADTAPRAGLGGCPAVFPAVSAALAAGEIGVHLAEVIVKGVNEGIRHADSEDLLRAERVLVQEWQARLDPDGSAPNEEALEAKSTLSFGPFQRGLYKISGGVTPDLCGECETYCPTAQEAPPTSQMV